jgi:hypothetical protein
MEAMVPDTEWASTPQCSNTMHLSRTQPDVWIGRAGGIRKEG